MLLLPFYRVTLEDLYSASNIQCGFRLALLFLGNVVTVLSVITLKSIPECLSFRGGSRMKWRGIACALKNSPPTTPTQTTALFVRITQHQLLYTPGCLLSSQWQCAWCTVWLYSSFIQQPLIICCGALYAWCPECWSTISQNKTNITSLFDKLKINRF